LELNRWQQEGPDPAHTMRDDYFSCCVANKEILNPSNVNRISTFGTFPIAGRSQGPNVDRKVFSEFDFFLICQALTAMAAGYKLGLGLEMSKMGVCVAEVFPDFFFLKLLSLTFR
jgi:hypothetical protein